MDERRFDEAIRALNGAVSRRQGMVAALGALLAGTAGLRVTVDARSRNRRRAGKRGPAQEGPCGDGSRKDNLCAKDGDCCTGICTSGLKNKDGEGRCRCARRGKECSEDRNCCGGRPCVEGICGGGSGPGSCGPASCAQGCCDQGACILPPHLGGNPADLHTKCGTGGVTCEDCTKSGEICYAFQCKQCAPNASSCTATACCAGSSCLDGVCVTQNGGACLADAGCIQVIGIPGVVICDPGTKTCCGIGGGLGVGAPCGNPADCCSGSCTLGWCDT